MQFQLDLNTLIGGLTLLGIVWVIRTVWQIDKRQALMEQAEQHREKELLELRTRVTAVEAEVQEIKVAVAKAIFGDDPQE